jgi:hypothetical protein
MYSKNGIHFKIRQASILWYLYFSLVISLRWREYKQDNYISGCLAGVRIPLLSPAKTSPSPTLPHFQPDFHFSFDG